jgi:predicted secreted hydrolase
MQSHVISARIVTSRHMTSTRRLIFLLGWLAIVLPSIAADTTSFVPAREGYRYAFPRDHGSHDEFRTEWWYYTGNLATNDGRQFGYQLTFFRRSIPLEQVKTLPSRWSITQLYLAHFAVTDLKNGRFHVFEKLSRAGVGKAGAEAERLHVWIDQWRAQSFQAEVGSQTLQASDDDVEIDLTVVPEKAPVIHGKGGVSRKGAESGQASHYYSLTRLATSGTIRLGNEPFNVTGTSWMDHEFGSADLGKDLVGWDWFSIQLADHTELMLYRMRRSDGSPDSVSSGTFIDHDGRAQHLTLGEFMLEPLTTWTSPASKARYPSTWRLSIPSKGLSLALVPRMTEQELTTNRSTQVTYWEGAIEASGTLEGKPIAGRGYMELTGYAERFSKKL